MRLRALIQGLGGDLEAAFHCGLRQVVAVAIIEIFAGDVPRDRGQRHRRCVKVRRAAPAQFLDLARYGFQLRSRAGHDCDIRASLGKRQCDRPSDTAAAAGHQSPPSAQANRITP
jgi:hypothetical protein